jgi:glycosyltransferase involved in cell wall biosynthesis
MNPMCSDPVPHGASKVSIVLHSFDRGGSGRVAGYLARGFAERGIDVELLVFCRGGEAERSVRNLVRGAAPIRFLGELRGPRPLDLVRGLPKLVAALRDRSPDVVIAAANNVALVATAAVRLAGLDRARLFLKTTNPIAGSRHRGPARVLRSLTYGRAFRRIDGVWTLSADETREMVAAFPTHARLFRDVANPYVTAEMLAPSRTDRRGATPRRIVTVARLTRQKRLDRLLRAFAEIRRPDVELLVLGEGEDRPKLEQLVDDLGIGDRVSMPGHVNDVAAALHASDLFVLTSDYEGLPAVVLEAMATNCPVISTASFPAARTLLDGAPGCRVIEYPSPIPLARLMEELLDQPRPTGLRPLAERYSVASGVESHLAAMLIGAGAQATAPEASRNLP